jgi:hypothetical protein
MARSSIPKRVLKPSRHNVYRATPSQYWQRRVIRNPKPIGYPHQTIIDEPFYSDSDTDGTSLSSSNTVFDLFNSPGTSVFRYHPYSDGKSGTLATNPPYRDGCAEFAVETRVIKETGLLPGATNGGQPLMEWYTRFYFQLSDAPTQTTRIALFEQSVANGGADICCIRVQVDGTFSMMDGTTADTTTSAVSAIDKWVRLEWKCDRRNSSQTLRLFHGKNLNNVDTTGGQDEQMNFTMATTGDPEVTALGIMLGPQAPALFRFSCYTVATGTWVGPPLGIRPRNQTSFGLALQSKLANGN